MMLFPLLRADLFVKHNIGSDDQRREMIEYAQSIKTQCNGAGLNFSNNNCWRHEFDYPDIKWLMEELRLLTNTAIDHYVKVDPSYAPKVREYQTPEVNYWTNINEPGSRNVMHDHRLHHYVAVYYLQGEGTGELVFHNPMNVLESCHPHAAFASKYAYFPHDGDLVLWPAWMPHETEVNNSNHQRINVAFNIRFKTPRYIP